MVAGQRLHATASLRSLCFHSNQITAEQISRADWKINEAQIKMSLFNKRDRNNQREERKRRRRRTKKKHKGRIRFEGQSQTYLHMSELMLHRSIINASFHVCEFL